MTDPNISLGLKGNNQQANMKRMITLKMGHRSSFASSRFMKSLANLLGHGWP